jgi:hypothetical protein
MKLELGCGNKPTEGYTHHDKWKHDYFVDVAWDLQQIPWPLEDGSLDEILATDVFEHLKMDVQVWLDECHRLLRQGGILNMRLPAWDNHYSYRDPTHYRVFHPESFLYWCPGPESGTVWQDFGRYYFGENYSKWWKQLEVRREFNDLRYTLEKL